MTRRRWTTGSGSPQYPSCSASRKSNSLVECHSRSRTRGWACHPNGPAGWAWLKPSTTTVLCAAVLRPWRDNRELLPWVIAGAMLTTAVFVGLSVKGAVTQAMVKTMAAKPIIFAMANPDPEITPEDIKSVRNDAIIATGRSDYPNQVNNVLGFPYIFRGALDVRARSINEEMKVAAAQALAELAREDVPDEVAAAYHGARPTFGRDYIIPTPFDPRLISFVPPLVAQAAMDSGVARNPIADMDAYRRSLVRRADPSAAFLQGVQARCRDVQRRIVFAEGEEPAVVRAAWSFKNQGLGHPILIGREAQVQAMMEQMGVPAGALVPQSK